MEANHSRHSHSGHSETRWSQSQMKTVRSNTAAASWIFTTTTQYSTNWDTIRCNVNVTMLRTFQWSLRSLSSTDSILILIDPNQTIKPCNCQGRFSVPRAGGVRIWIWWLWLAIDMAVLCPKVTRERAGQAKVLCLPKNPMWLYSTVCCMRIWFNMMTPLITGRKFRSQTSDTSDNMDNLKAKTWQKRGSRQKR